jgi:hypothetical protein
MDTCPHCGTRLPVSVDAFCPDCRQPLGEPPGGPRTGVERPSESRPGHRRVLLGVVIMFGGLAAILVGALACVRRNWPEALVTGGGGLALVLGGAWWSSQSRMQRSD